MARCATISRSRYLSILTLAVIGLAQPIFDLVGRYPEFLVVHGVDTLDLLLFAALAVTAPTLSCWAVVGVAACCGRRCGEIAYEVVVVALVTALALPLAGQFLPTGGWLVLAVAVALGVAVARILSRSESVRRILALAAATVPLLLALFLLKPGIRPILARQGKIEIVAKSRIENPAPVFLVVFDELPLTSLLAADGSIDSELFPGFARLAGISTWYPNATTVSDATERSLFAILTGTLPAWTDLPDFKHQPRNLFTMFAATHAIHVMETQTGFCPDELVTGPKPSRARKARRFYSDLMVLAGHIWIPPAWRTDLAPISNKWSGFAAEPARDGEKYRRPTRVDMVEEYIAGIERSGAPPLGVMHTLLPHNPYMFFPSGRAFNWRRGEPVDDDVVWPADEVIVQESYRRHLIQLTTVDRLLSDLLDRLEDLDLLDESLVVVTSDHGACFGPGLPYRKYDPTNAGDIVSIPLFVKDPGQTVGRTDTRHVQTVDIVPTIADRLEVDIDWEFDGVSLCDHRTAQRDSVIFLDHIKRRRLKVPVAEHGGISATVAFMAGHFPVRSVATRLYAPGPRWDLFDKRVVDLPVRESDVASSMLRYPERYEEMRMDRRFRPAEIEGTLWLADDVERYDLAIALGGRIRGLTRTSLPVPGESGRAWTTVVPEDSFEPGLNRIEVYLVEGPPSRPVLTRVRPQFESVLGKTLGVAKVARVGESGFYQTEVWPEGTTRWTDGNATLEIPLQDTDRPGSLGITLASTGPRGTELEIRVNGAAIYAERVERGPQEIELTLEDPAREKSLRLEILSSTFVPGPRDPRSLGVAVRAVVVHPR